MKILTLAVLGALTFSASAQLTPKTPSQHKFQGRKSNVALSGDLLKGEIQIQGKSGNSLSGFKAPAKETEIPKVIWGVKGKSETYSKSASGLYPDYTFGMIFPFDDGDLVSRVVWGDEDDVYFRDPITYSNIGSYVKGDIDGNTISVALPQCVLWIDDDEDFPEGYGLNLAMLKREAIIAGGDTVYTYEYDPSIESAIYEMKESGEISLMLPGEPYDGKNLAEYALGLIYSDDNSWSYYCEYRQEFTNFNMDPVTIPEGLEVKPYAALIEDYGNFIGVADGGEEIYIQGFCSQVPEQVFKAVVTDHDKNGKTIAYIPQNQMMGTYFDMYFVVTKIISINLVEIDGEDQYVYEFMPDSEKYYIEIDNETGEITPQSSKYYLCCSYSFEDPYAVLEGYNNFRLVPQSSNAGTPSNPMGLEYDEDGADLWGYNSFYFTLPQISEEGTLLDASHLYYRIYIDGEILVFEEERGIDLAGDETIMYQGLPGATDLIPFYFNNGWDIYLWTDTTREIGIYIEGIETIGVQGVYVYEDVTTESDVVTLNLGEEDGVNSIFNEEDVVSSEYFNIAGQKVLNPGNGIFIRKAVLSDGSVKTIKVIKK